MRGRQWDDARIERLKALHAERLPYAVIGKEFGVSGRAIAGAVRRYIHKIPDPRAAHERNHKQFAARRSRVRQPTMWTEATLTEPYAARKARLAEERRAN